METTKQGMEGKTLPESDRFRLNLKVTSLAGDLRELLNLTQVFSLSIKGDNHTYLRKLLRGLKEIMTCLAPSRNSIVQRQLADTALPPA